MIVCMCSYITHIWKSCCVSFPERPSNAIVILPSVLSSGKTGYLVMEASDVHKDYVCLNLIKNTVSWDVMSYGELYCTEDAQSRFLKNVGTYLQNHTTQ